MKLQMPDWRDDSVLGTLGTLVTALDAAQTGRVRTLLLFVGLRADSRPALATYLEKHQPCAEPVSAAVLRKHWHMLANREKHVMADNLDPAMFRHAPFVKFGDGSYGCAFWVYGAPTSAELGIFGIEHECRIRALGRSDHYVRYAVCPVRLLRDFAQQYIDFGTSTLGDGTPYPENPGHSFVDADDGDRFDCSAGFEDDVEVEPR